MCNVKGRRGRERWRKKEEWKVILPTGTGKESERVLKRRRPLGEEVSKGVEVEGGEAGSIKRRKKRRRGMDVVV